MLTKVFNHFLNSFLFFFSKSRIQILSQYGEDLNDQNKYLFNILDAKFKEVNMAKKMMGCLKNQVNLCKLSLI